MSKHNELGKRGEEAAVDYLRRAGYTIVAKNWFHEKYEIDVIAQDDEYIIFVEVKSRTSAQWGNPEEAVTKGKIRRIVEAADFYLKEYDIDKPARFDVIAMVWNGEAFDTMHFEDAFLPPVM